MCLGQKINKKNQQQQNDIFTEMRNIQKIAKNYGKK